MPNSPLKCLILLFLKNNGHAKLSTHTKEHFDNNSYFEIFRKLTAKLFLRLLVYKCLYMSVWQKFFQVNLQAIIKEIPPGYTPHFEKE